jgi:hypothetical protein
LAFTPETPVRNAATRSARGNRFGAITPAEPNRISSSSGRLGATGTGRSWKRWSARCSESPKASAADRAVGRRSSYWNLYFCGQSS